MRQDREKDKILLEKVQTEVRKATIEKIVQIRKEKKITQQELAERTGILRPNIARMESGNYNPTIDMLVRLADGLGMDVDIQLLPRE
ncbi:MAG: helix-turn-helix domain-containing protein [Lachnospiraceae bacterium]|nr:helix-turn-helix domain-containing protein [Lachnospiraceae bacterium]